MAIAAVASMALFGCGHTLSFDQGRYEVRVFPLTAKGHKYEQTKVGDLTLSLDEMVVTYEFQGNWASTAGLWPDREGYANVMATVFGHVEGYQLSTADADANAIGLALAGSFGAYGFRCDAPRSDAAAGLPGVVVECEARRRTSDVQKLRARELWGADGVIVQVVTWTVGSKVAPEADKFWGSLHFVDEAGGASRGERTLALGSMPVDAVVSHTFGGHD